MSKEELLKELWNTCTIEEIVEAGYKHQKLSSVDLVKVADEYNIKTSSEERQSFIDALEELFEQYDRKSWYVNDVMSILEDHFSQYSMLNFFNEDDMIDHLDGSWEMEKYLSEHTKKEIEYYKEENPTYTKDDLIKEYQDAKSYDLKRLLCDLTEASYYTSNEELLNNLKNRI